MNTFRHVILTRFNIRVEQAAPADSSWLDHRFALFERFCLPSVQAQKCQNFTWVLFCDPDIPAKYHDRIAAYAQWPNLRPIFFRHVFDKDMVRATVAAMAIDCTHLITSRLDNDDAICRTFIESVQTRFSGQDFEFLNFTNGYILDAEEGTIWSGQHSSNAFISLVERADNYSTVYCANHMELNLWGPIHQIENPVGWLQVVHRKNLLNRVWGTPVSGVNLYEDFGITEL